MIKNHYINDSRSLAFYVIPLKNTLNTPYYYQGSIMKITKINFALRISKFQFGFTLFETLIVLTIIGILMSFATPSFYAFSAKTEAKAVIQTLSGLIRHTRNNAINMQTPSLLCPSKEGLICENNWEEGVLIFEDTNNDKQLNNAENVIYFQESLIDSGSIHWTALHNYVAFSGEGLNSSTAGSFIYCPENKDPHYAHALIISFSGKLRRAIDSNNDGIRETGNNKNINCL